MAIVFKSSLSKEPTQLEKDNALVARMAAREGFVLLKNDGVLPLKGKGIALYGAGARMTVKGGRGSGEVRNRHSVSIESGLADAGYDILTTSWLDAFDKFYADTYEAYRVEMEKRVEGIKDFHKIQRAMIPFQHPSGIPVEEKHLADTDTAIYVLARQAGEGHDRKAEEGDYYLTSVEKENLSYLSQKYENLIVIVNVGGLLDLSFLDTLHVSALVYYVQGGEEGGHALADLLSGQYNFSGKMATSWPYHFEDCPSSSNYSDASPDKYTQDYNEGIYVGYRYYDSFGVKPRFPFGFGLSYTTFDIAYKGFETCCGKLCVSASISNTGDVSGKDVAQLYVSVPFANGNEAKRLVAFKKSSLLEASKAQDVELCFTYKDLAVYDETKASWVLPAGDYVFLLGDSSDTAKPVAVLTLSQEKVLEQCTNICPMTNEVAEIKAPQRKAFETSGLPCFALDDKVPQTVVHTYETPEVEVDPFVKTMTDEQLKTLCIGATVSPADLQITALGASGSTTGELYEELGIPNVVLSDGPAGLNLSPYTVQMPDGTVKGARVPENLEAYKRYLFGFNKIIMVARMAKPEDGTMRYQFTTAWPCSQLLAQTFDPQILETVGDCVGKEMEQFGVTIWLAPGMNIHRNPLCGRTFEYYSEDPLVSGKMAAAIVRGVQSNPGKGMSIKHFVANNCELMRNWSSSNVHEKALREIYLRGFEIAVKESNPLTVMASYNKVNGLHVVNNYDLLAKVLRNEWKFEGLVMSDWDSMKASPEDPCTPLTGDVQKAQAAQMDLICPGRADQHIAMMKGMEEGKVTRADLERSATRILKLIRQNNVVPCKV